LNPADQQWATKNAGVCADSDSVCCVALGGLTGAKFALSPNISIYTFTSLSYLRQSYYFGRACNYFR